MPSLAPAREALTFAEEQRRLARGLPTVQGVDVDFDALTLRSGQSLRAFLGDSVTGATMTRSIEGSSVITITVYDERLELLDRLDEHWRFTVEGLGFTYTGCQMDGKSLTLTFYEDEVAALKRVYGPVKAFRSEMTRAEFIYKLVSDRAVRKLAGKIPVHIPEMHVRQPVAKQTGRPAAPRDAAAVQTPGFSGNVTVKGAKPNSEQRQVATDAMLVADRFDAPYKARVAMFCALTQENNMTASTNDGPFAFLDSTAASLGVNKHDTKACAKLFLVDGIWDPPGQPKLGAIEWANRKPDADPGWIAQQIEGSAYPTLYSQWADEARRWVDAWSGSSGASAGGGTATVTEPYAFEVRKNEDYWAAIQRLAKEVNFRAFITAGRFFYVAEPELFAQKVRLGVVRGDDGNPETRGVDSVGFSYQLGVAITEASLSARAKDWACPPGTVVTLRGYGPASVGDYWGEPRTKVIGHRNGKPIRAGLDQARPAVGRYIVTQIDSDFFTDAVTVTLRKPTAPLPEPANAERTVATQGGGAAVTGEGVPEPIAKMIAEIDRIDSKHYSYSSPGARGTPPPANGPYDCSGFVSRVLYVGGLGITTSVATPTLAGWGQGGAGDWLYIRVRPPAGPSGHVIGRIRTPDGWRWFATSDAHAWSGDGAGWVPDSAYSASYLASLPVIRHWKGL